MKKTYIIPEMLTTEIVVEQLLASSPGGVNNNGDVVVPQGTPTDGDGDDAAVKSNYDVWDDDWSR